MTDQTPPDAPEPQTARSPDAPPHTPGLAWTLSEETRAALADIDASIRQARVDGPTALFD